MYVTLAQPPDLSLTLPTWMEGMVTGSPVNAQGHCEVKGADAHEKALLTGNVLPGCKLSSSPVNLSQG